MFSNTQKIRPFYVNRLLYASYIVVLVVLLYVVLLILIFRKLITFSWNYLKLEEKRVIHVRSMLVNVLWWYNKTYSSKSKYELENRIIWKPRHGLTPLSCFHLLSYKYLLCSTLFRNENIFVKFPLEWRKICNYKCPNSCNIKHIWPITLVQLFLDAISQSNH